MGVDVKTKNMPSMYDQFKQLTNMGNYFILLKWLQFRKVTDGKKLCNIICQNQ